MTKPQLVVPEPIDPIKDAMAAADERLEAGVAAALSEPKPIFRTHSTALAGEIAAKAESYKALVAEIDARIAALEAERTDLMLSYSMLSGAMNARERADV
jgi:hypothetical protein